MNARKLTHHSHTTHTQLTEPSVSPHTQLPEPSHTEKEGKGRGDRKGREVLVVTSKTNRHLGNARDANVLGLVNEK